MTAIEFEQVSKKFVLHHERPRSLQEMVIGLLRPGRQDDPEEFWALKDVSFEVPRGETIGLIGPNGSGKSTTLKLIARILEPTSGQIRVNGRVSTLLELGAGFHPDLTGRENVYLNGSIHGLRRREIEERFQSIVSFAELEPFIDVQVRHYSSGMYVRLAFAVAAHMDPDILLVDETLAVGDHSFQMKCLDRIRDLQRRGVTIVFVSHDLSMVEHLCSHAILLHRGRVKARGRPPEVVSSYLADLTAAEEARLKEEQPTGVEHRWGSREVEITKVKFLDSHGQERRTFNVGDTMIARIEYQAPRRVERPVFGVAIHRRDGLHITGPNTKSSGYEIDAVEGRGAIDFIADRLPLREGVYQFTATVYDYDCLHPYDHHDRAYTFRVNRSAAKEVLGMLEIPCRWERRRLS